MDKQGYERHGDGSNEDSLVLGLAEAQRDTDVRGVKMQQLPDPTSIQEF